MSLDVFGRHTERGGEFLHGSLQHASVLTGSGALVQVVVLMHVCTNAGAPTVPILGQPDTRTCTLLESVSTPLAPSRADAEDARNEPHLLLALHVLPHLRHRHVPLRSITRDAAGAHK